MVFKNICIFDLRTKIASALEGLNVYIEKALYRFYILNMAKGLSVYIELRSLCQSSSQHLTACYSGHLSVNITVNHTMNLLFSIFMYLTIKVMYV